MCTALPLDEIYPPTKFHNHSFYSHGDMHLTKFKFEKKRAITQRLSKQELRFIYSFGDMHQTKAKYKSKQRAITQKKQTRVMVHVHCTPL